MLLHQWFKIPKHAYHNSLISLGQVLVFLQGATQIPITKSADSPMKEKHSPESVLDHPNRSSWYWPELGGGWYKTAKKLDEERSARLSSILEEEYSGTTISPSEEAWIMEEVRAVMNSSLRRPVQNWKVIQ